jgi:hypothetical protein
MAASGPLKMDSLTNSSQSELLSETMKSRTFPDVQLHLGAVTKNATVLPDVMSDSDSDSDSPNSLPPSGARDLEVRDLSTSSADRRELSGPAGLVTSTDFLRLQETVNELNDLLNRQSQILIALTERQAGPDATIKRSSLLPLQRSETYPSKISALAPAITSQVFEVRTIWLSAKLAMRKRLHH